MPTTTPPAYARVHDRAADYDRRNVFFTEDLDELKASGYLRTLVPVELGGLGLKLRATANARFVVDQAIRVTGGSAYSMSSELGRLYRDVLAGGFHPSNEDSVHSTVATALLGPLAP